MPFFCNWPRRTAKLTEEQVEDVILHCREPSQDAEYAAQYGVSAACIASIRRRRSWWHVWERLIDDGQVGTEGE
jgi:hypothetical protein